MSLKAPRKLTAIQEDDLRVLRDASKAAKTAYDEAVTVRAEAARDVNALLERKHSWTDADVSRFTTLVRSDHSSNHAVHLTSSQLKEAELAVDKAFSDLTQAILERYHEEQVWSDKIRNVSTWAGVVGLLVNFVVFIGAIAVVEPWKRRRLVERLEERMTGMMEKVEGAVELLAHRFDDLESGSGLPQTSATQTPDVLHASGSQDSPPPVVLRRPLWTVALDWLPRDLESIAQPSPERDLAVVGLCGAAGGAALVACLSWLLRG